MIKKFILILIIFLSFETVSALDFCSASKDYKNYENLKDKQDYVEPIYCGEIMNTNLSGNIAGGSIISGIYNPLSTANTPTYYNAYNDGIVNNPENQYQTGLCWDFSALSAVETNAKKNGNALYNFSEAHLAYSILGGVYSNNEGLNGRYNADVSGGQITYAPTYFFNSYGQKQENEMPFLSNLIPDTTNLKPINSANYSLGNQTVSVEGFFIDNISENNICTSSEISEIKDKILKYGSVQATMYMDSDLFDSTRQYYISTKAYSNFKNHGVVIVGWDDNVSMNNFEGATRNGAWIVKNSWGPNWSNDGLFYISYDDEFICKMTATFTGVSTKTFENTYKSADVVGTLETYLTGKTYMTTKFTKQTAERESLERVSFAVGDYMSYDVYLSKDNDLSNKDNWIHLTSGTSNEYGIDSVNLSGIYIDDDFTIIVEYDIDEYEYSSVFTTCQSEFDTNHLSISQNTNFESTNGTDWTDMFNYRCEPNIYAYTNSVSDETKLEINALVNINDLITVKISRNNIDTNDLLYTVVDSNNNDVTSNFTIIPIYKNNEISVVSDNSVSGTFTFNINYQGNTISKTFKLEERLSSKNDNLRIDIDNQTGKKNMVITIGKGETLTYQTLLNYLDIENTRIDVENAKGNDVISSSDAVGTGSKLITNNNEYSVVVLGDATGDGKISALDYIAIRKHMIKSNENDLITDLIKKSAVDMNNDGRISALDYIAIRKIMIGG